VAKLVWRVKLVAEFQAGVTTEVEVGRFERDEQASVADLGLRLGEAKQITAALQAEMVPRQVTVVGERHRLCATCGCVLASKGYYPATFRSLFGNVPVRVRRLLVCPCCQGSGGAKSFAVLDLEAATMAPELAYVTTRYAALAPFGQVAALLSELLPISGARNAATVRNRTLRVGEAVVQLQVTKTAQQMAAKLAEPVVVGLDGGYVRSRHRQEERHFEVIAGKVIDAHGSQSRFAFARNSPTIASSAFKQALAAAGVQADTPATVLCDGDAGLWRLRTRRCRRARSCSTGGTPRCASSTRCRRPAALARARPTCTWPTRRFAKWRLWHGRWPGCRRRLAGLCRWAQRKHVRDVAGIGRLERHVSELLGYLERNQGVLVHYAARRRRGEPISTAFVESAVNEIVATRMNKKQQMRWNRTTVQPFLDVRTAMLNDTLDDAFRHRYPGFRPANDDQVTATAA